MEGRSDVGRGVTVLAAVGLLVLPVSCTGDEPFDAAPPLLPTTTPASDLDGSEAAPIPETAPSQPDPTAAGSDVEAPLDTEATGADAETTADAERTVEGTDEVSGDGGVDIGVSAPVGAADGGVDIGVSAPVGAADGGVRSDEPAVPSPPAPVRLPRPAPVATNEGSGGGSTVSGPDLIARQPPPPQPPTPQPTPPPTGEPEVPPTIVLPSPSIPPPALPPTCFGRTIDECTGEVIPEGAVTQMGEYQTNVRVPAGKAVDIYFDQARSVDEMSHLCASMGGTLRQRGPDGSRWSGWWFCDDVVP